MKNILLLTTILIMMCSTQSFSQDSRAIRAARASYASAENHFKRGNFEMAAREYEIVINTIPESTDSRKNLEMRLESMINLVEIYFYKQIDFTKACENLQMYYQNMNRIRNAGTLKASDLLNYQRKEKEFEADYSPKCRNYEGIHHNMENFKKKFDEEFE
jgi:outer membrane protein assembly factor BamD (BamD/ComL family)